VFYRIPNYNYRSRRIVLRGEEMDFGSGLGSDAIDFKLNSTVKMKYEKMGIDMLIKLINSYSP
jgi:hypothetical protein